MAGDVDEVIFCRNDIDPPLSQQVLEPRNGFFVSGNHARRKDNGIIFVEDDMGMIVRGNLGQGRARFSLTAGADQQGLLAGKIANFRI